MTYEEALKKAANYCAKYETCPFDLKGKFRQWGVPEEYYERIIAYLEENNFINQIRYTRSFVKDKCYLNHWGKLKITYALRQKQIPDSFIEQSIEEIIDNQDYTTILRNLLSQKLKSIQNKTTDKYKIKQKLISFAQSRGFESELAYQISEELINNSK